MHIKELEEQLNTMKDENNISKFGVRRRVNQRMKTSAFEFGNDKFSNYLD
jgi:hypothetical protein